MLTCIGCGASVEAGAHRWNEGINDSLVLCADCWDELTGEEREADALEARAQQRAAGDAAESEAED